METISFSELFDFAEKTYGIHWNPANDLFFSSILTYNQTNTIYDSEWIYELGYKVDNHPPVNSIDITHLKNHAKALVIAAAFLQSKNLKSCEIDSH